MSLSLQLENIKCNERSILTIAFHPDVQTSTDAKMKLANANPGSFLTFSANGNNYCAVVDHEGQVSINPFRWDASGLWYNGGCDPFATEMDLLDHLVKGQEPIPFFCDSL